MQFPHAPQQTQLPLFEAFLAQPLAPILKDVAERPWNVEPEAFSELSLRGAAGNCLNLLAPILRELSDDQDARWLTLIAPPASLTQTWLRDAGLNRERILLLHPRGTQSAQQLACEALRLGRSHTVVTWLNPLNSGSRQQLISAARTGDAQSLNIRLG
ncbi:CDP-glycerol--UDP-pyrophosphoryl-N-acetylglucosaminyl-N-acetylmannosamine glycerophosphotransferase [Pseudomonas sp. FW215-R2]|uniref:SOS-induced cell division inhibitor SulA n=1 Tax=Pseudomonas TaxID=286 RepID=UPI000BC9C27A|nr:MULTISPECIES: SOS-induced cell division inhibitor SulA [Pseudomonas]PCR94097.1 CDP-glycerol--UDP-pyrophosphoryl-N-acetylglucosaminyl-N-acetylmannosamine glycerophosphotransferase [Pseudomonas fluorescens]PMW96810.1 CDP-glycerol--UDP-pyrophosphoryl-N-acetylglucosaminyl-N-acetylmannosamine glycerophosphotransferase [Pseudomonas sp. FW215-R2]PMX07075.1 CDP-glycerol--UDP-pyrophosphoryl-N-acetylglucosaminyl-N-acetylmannosamine glycerophosphotransferase [Pseudomonas sp. FW215-L1]PMX20161.1 CDP-gly